MAKIGRPPMTEAQVRQRINDYCARYGVTEVNDAGFPAFPAGRRETEQHREWITLFKLFARYRERAGLAPISDPAVPAPSGSCDVCQKSLPASGKPHRRCADVVELVRDLGPASLDRIRAAAFPPKRKGPARP
jgi:hypothetical protein